MDAVAVTALIERVGAQLFTALAARPAELAADPLDVPALPPKRADVKCPSYDGSTDVENLIRRFEGIAELAQWLAELRLLHLQAALIGGSEDLGHAETEDGVLAALRLRYGLTAREATSRLEGIHRDTNTLLQDHANKFQKLGAVAHAGQSTEHRTEIIKEKLLSSLGNLGLQRHLLSIATPTIDEVVRAGNAYLQLTGTQVGPRAPEGCTYQVQGEDQTTIGGGKSGTRRPLRCSTADSRNAV